MADDDFVISGISARFPQADSLTEFKEKLYAGVDLVTDDEARWPRGTLGVPARKGTIRDLSCFDAQFFSVPPRQAHVMDPQLRLLLETTHEAIVDAGYDPATLRGNKIGVFVGSALYDTFSALNGDSDRADGYTVTCSMPSTLANRLAYCFDFRGPSFTLDSASSSSMTALNLAMLALRSGQCNAAVVGGANMLLNPCTTLNLTKMNMLSPDGRSKSFDISANGYVRSETVGAVFLQRESDARRVYAKIIHVKCNTDGYKIEGPTYPSGKVHEQLLREVYSEAKIDPREVFYVEAHATGTRAGDPQESGAFTAVFCPPGRMKPLKIGSVKSNMGHAEGASGIASMAKVILAMETGVLAGNLHFKVPNQNIPALHDGRLEVVTEVTPFPGGLIGVHSCGIGGTNVHAILESNSGPHVDTLPRQKAELPRLVLMAGRSRDSLKASLDRLAADRPYPDSAYALLNRVGQPNVKQFRWRAYVLVHAEDSSRKDVLKVVDQAPSGKRPVWFAFAGMGCQWNGMARQMMHFDLFAQSIRKCHDVAQQFGIDLITLITSHEDCSSTVGSLFVSIVAIQVALVDTLRAMGIQPDGVVGHSLGEIGCGYADGGITAEQAILCAYWRGRCTEQGGVPEGAMAAVGLSWEEAQKRCSGGVQAVCDNAKDSVSVSGPADAVAKLVEQLTAEGVFARKVDTMNVAFHSSLIQSVGPALKEALQKVFPEPKPRSERWISSSVPESLWTEPMAKHCSADYFVNNFLSPVLFREAMQHLPPDAIVVEIAPHCLLQSILRRNMGASSSLVGLMKRDVDNHSFFLSSLGKLHTLSVQLDLSPLYPPVSWPVPRGTPSIGHLVAWDHSQRWNVVAWDECVSSGRARHGVSPTEEFFGIDVGANEADEYLADHQVDGQVAFPLGGIIVLVWKCLAKRCGEPFDTIPVVFENVTLHRTAILPPNSSLHFSVSIRRNSSKFKVFQGGALVASGCVRVAIEGLLAANNEDLLDSAAEELTYELEAEDIYQEFALRGHEYGPAFRSIVGACIKQPFGKLRWDGNWVTFIEGMLQFCTLRNSARTLTTPYQVRYCLLDPKVHAEVVEEAPDCGMDVVYSHHRDMCHAGGALLRGVEIIIAKRSSQQQTPTLEVSQFVPYMDDETSRIKREAVVQEYINVCGGVAHQLLVAWNANEEKKPDTVKGLHEVPQQLIESYLEKPAEKHGLLRTLTSIPKDQNVKAPSLQVCINSVLTVHKEDMENDLLNTALFEEDTLGHLLEVAVENTSIEKMKVLELVSEDSFFAPWIIPFLSRSTSLTQIEYTLAHTSPDKLTPAHVPEGVKTVLWDPSFILNGNRGKADLIAVRGGTCTSRNLEKLAEELHMLCTVNGFVLVFHRTALTPPETFLSAEGKAEIRAHPISKVEPAFSSCGFRLAALKSNNVSALLLFRKIPVQAPKVEVIRLNSKPSFLVTAIKKKALDYEIKSTGENLWMFAAGTSGVVGLTECLRHEAGEDRIRCILDTSIDEPHKMADFSPSDPAYKDVLEKDLVTNVYQDGQWGSYRRIAMKSCGALKKLTELAVLDQPTSGDLDSLEWFESQLRYSLPLSRDADADLILCSVYYASVNHRDVVLATEKTLMRGHIAGAEYGFGQEFSGRDTQGRRVMGVVQSHAIATMVAANSLLLWDVPESWTLEQASTVPLAYSTAYYALFVRANMGPGETVLVHPGSTCLGLAAISIALSVGATVFTTVGSDKERQLLNRKFPQMKNWQLLSSRDIFLLDHISQHTGGKGVDFVLNCSGGRLPWTEQYPDAHKRGPSTSPLLGAVSLTPKIITVGGNFLDALHSADAQPDRRRVLQLVRDGISSGAVRPLDATVFKSDQAAEAFRSAASEADLRKVVIQVRPEESDRNTGPPPPLSVNAVARTNFYAHKAYIIAGGLCTFGMELADWMISRGCRKLILTSGCGERTGHHMLYLHRWQCVGAKVRISNTDISTAGGTREIIGEAADMGPVGGIFNLESVLLNTLLEGQAVQDWEALCERKVNATNLLDQTSRKLCPQLDHFVVFSSACYGRGHPGKAHCHYADPAAERICERRAADGLPGLAIQWGAISDVKTTNDNVGSDVPISGYEPQRISSCLETMERFLNQRHPVVSSVIRAAASHSTLVSKDRQDLVLAVAEILGFNDPSQIDSSATLADLGMDSVMGVDVLHAIERHCDLTLCINEVRLLSLKALLEMTDGSRERKYA